MLHKDLADVNSEKPFAEIQAGYLTSGAQGVITVNEDQSITYTTLDGKATSGELSGEWVTQAQVFHKIDGVIQPARADYSSPIATGDGIIVFQRGQGSSGNGSGLGLAITKGIVLAHEGRIWVEDAPKGGAVFNVALPRKKENLERAGRNR